MFLLRNAAVTINEGSVLTNNVQATDRSDRHMATPYLKRAFDVSSATVAILVLAPIFVFILSLLLLAQGRPIFIKHKRIGRGGQTFGCLKFRTMVVEADAVLAAHLASNPQAQTEWQQTRKLRGDPRVTKFGRFLRKSSIDELPQLLNIIKGEMSVVGPRPIVAAEIGFYGDKINDYQKVRPGLTGLWQISGRSDTTYASRVEFDSTYSASFNFRMDLVIIAKTIPAVFSSRGSY